MIWPFDSGYEQQVKRDSGVHSKFEKIMFEQVKLKTISQEKLVQNRYIDKSYLKNQVWKGNLKYSLLN